MTTFLYRKLQGNRALVVLAVGLTFAQVLADLLTAFPLKFILDKVINGRDPSFPIVGRVITLFDSLSAEPAEHAGEHTQVGVIVFSATMLITLGLLTALLSYGQLFIAAYVGQDVSARIRAELFGHLQRLPLAWHGQQRTGDLVQRLTGNVADIEKLVTDGLVDLLAGMLTLVGIFIVMMTTNWQFTVLSMIVAPALFVVVLGYTRSIKAATRAASKIGGQVGDIATEDLGAILEVKAFTLESREVAHFGEVVGRQRAAGLRAGRLQAEFTPLVLIVIAISNVTIIGVGSYVATGHRLALGPLAISPNSLTIGTLTVYLAYLKQLYQPMRDLSKLMNVASSAASGCERIQSVLDEPTEAADAAGAGGSAKSRPQPPQTVRGDIAFRNVIFGYRDRHPVLNQLDLRVPAGKRVALVGLSGSGKTTMAKLIPRFYDVWGGSVCIDGVDVRDYPLSALRRNVSFVLQDSVLFEGTIRDNIAIGRPGATDAEVVAAARQAQIHDTILGLPEGYDSVVREQGKNLSGGQRQRIAIARAILRDAPILILDEPTASLDVEAEAEVMHAVDTLIVGRTVLMISHRLSTLGHVDEIVVLDEGRIIERGTYAELKLRGGVFARLLAEQHRYSAEADPAANTTAAAPRPGSGSGGQVLSADFTADRRSAASSRAH